MHHLCPRPEGPLTRADVLGFLIQSSGMKPWYITIWNEGQYVDFWSVNHTIAGLITYLITALLNIRFFSGLISMFILAVSWEGVELVKGIEETLSNRIVDIIIALIAFTAMHYIYKKKRMNLIHHIMILGGLALLLNVWGFWAMELSQNT